LKIRFTTVKKVNKATSVGAYYPFDDVTISSFYPSDDVTFCRLKNALLIRDAFTSGIWKEKISKILNLDKK
jgi:hypothetical protein